MSPFERVHTMNDYYDGPRRGIADYRGQPHLYESMFDVDADEYLDTYRLSPVSDSLLAFALEDWQIWLRWEAAFHVGGTTQATHPALPEDRDRHDGIAKVLKLQLVIDARNCSMALGKFRQRNEEYFPPARFTNWEVQWTQIMV